MYKLMDKDLSLDLCTFHVLYSAVIKSNQEFMYCFCIHNDVMKRLTHPFRVWDESVSTDWPAIQHQVSVAFHTKKANLSLCLTKGNVIKTYGGSERIALRILNLGARLR